MLPAYATREAVKRALDSAETARNNTRIDRACQAGSRAVDHLCRRRFYPELRTASFDWPNQQYAAPWRLWLDANELISLTTLTVGGEVIPSSDYLLRRMDRRDEPPYTLLEMNLATGSAFTSGPSTHQQSISGYGLYGYRNDETLAGTLVATISTTTEGTATVSDGSTVGVGDLLRSGTERMIVTGRDWTDSGQNTGAGLAASLADMIVPVATGSAYHQGELILVDAETMRVDGIAGNTLIVRRAWDGSALAVHSTGADIYVSRVLSVARGQLGTTAAGHASGAEVYRFDPPELVHDAALAEALVILEAQSTGYSGKRGSGESEHDPAGGTIGDARAKVCRAHRRHMLGPVAV